MIQTKHRVELTETPRGISAKCSCGKNCHATIKALLKRGGMVTNGTVSGSSSAGFHAVARKDKNIYHVLILHSATTEEAVVNQRKRKLRPYVFATFIDSDLAFNALLSGNVPDKNVKDKGLTSSGTSIVYKYFPHTKPTTLEGPDAQATAQA